MFKLKFSFFLTLFLLLIFSSCNKDEGLTTESETLIEESIALEKSGDTLEQKRKLLTETIKCYDSNVPEIGIPPFQVLYGEPNERSIIYTAKDGTNTYVFPLMEKDEIKNLFLITEKDESFLLERTKVLSLKDVDGTNISPYIANIHRFGEFIVPEINIERLRKVLHKNYGIAQPEKNVLRLKERNTISGSVSEIATQRLKPSCEAAINDMLPAYITRLGLPPNFDTDLLYAAIASCSASSAGSNGACKCPHPSCVLDNLIDIVEDDEIRKDLMIKAIDDELTLSPDLIECLEGSDESVSVEILELLDGEIMNPCNTDESEEQILNEALGNACSNSVVGGVSIDDFYEELNKEDYIVLAESFSSNQKVNCVWDNLIDSNDDLMCSTLSNFFGGSKLNLNLYVQNLNGQNGFTDILPSGNIAISLDSDYIEEACPVEILKTILHEAIHAEILRRMNAYTLAQLEVMFPDMMQYFNGPGDFHHEYMANERFDDLLNSVIQFYPGFTIDEYEAMVWSGLHNTAAFDDSGITLSELVMTIDSMRENCDQSCD